MMNSSGDGLRQEAAVPEFVRQLIDLMEARPFESVAVLIVVIMYLRFMTAGPRLD